MSKEEILEELDYQAKITGESIQRAGDTTDIFRAGKEASKLRIARNLIDDVIFVEGTDQAN